MRKTKVALVVAGGILMAAVTFAGGAFAINNVSALINGEYPTIVQNIATKFNLNPAEVEQVFETTRTQERADRLSEAVTNGDITEAQKALILAKQDEIHASMEKINSEALTADARHDAMEKLRSDLSDWADQNDIPNQFVMMGGGMGKGMGMGEGMGEGMGGGFGRGRMSQNSD